jgi:hypothetical protein
VGALVVVALVVAALGLLILAVTITYAVMTRERGEARPIDPGSS